MIGLSQEQYIDMYLRMQHIREFDMHTNKLVRHGFVQGVAHFSVGEEAAGIGAIVHLTYDDVILSNHRGHGQCIAKNMDLNKMMAEFAGKVTGVSESRGDSIHLTDSEKGNYGTNDIVGGGYALAIGAALAQHYQKTDSIVVTFSGDGATNEGSFHESVNLAATRGLPVILLIINNRYGTPTDITRTTNTPHLYTRAETYGIPGFYCEDGNGILVVYETMGKAANHMHSGDGPAIVEVEPYRWFRHSTANTGRYRSKEEVDGWKKKNPLIKFRMYLTENHLASHDKLDTIDAQMVKEIDGAYAFAQDSPEPDLSVTFGDIRVD